MQQKLVDNDNQPQAIPHRKLSCHISISLTTSSKFQPQNAQMKEKSDFLKTGDLNRGFRNLWTKIVNKAKERTKNVMVLQFIIHWGKSGHEQEN